VQVIVVCVIERIGISTHFLPAANGEAIWDAIDQVHAMGLRGFELVPNDHQGQLGHPYTIPNVGIWPRDFGPDQRERLAQALSVFDTVTIHAPHLDLNIASINHGIGEESQRQYFECIDLARDLGVQIVTFHRGHASHGFIRELTEIEQHNIEFGLRAAELAEKYDMLMGFEVTGPGGLESQMREIVAIASDRFGLNLDLGHAAMTGTPPEVWAREFAGKIVEVHINGVLKDWSGFSEHQPINRNNVIDYEAVVAQLKGQGFEGPLMCELQGFDIEDAVSNALAARALFIELWERL